MSYEPSVIENWIYDTLKADATLSDLLAVDNKPTGYQQGIYNAIAPQVDPVSRKAPAVPYVVFTLDSATADETALCGTRVFSRPSYRVTVWDNQTGAISMARVAAIMDRIDTLLDNQFVTSTTPDFHIRREIAGQTFTLGNDGRIDYGVTAVYRVVTQS
jgi:hypothetical protein